MFHHYGSNQHFASESMNLNGSSFSEYFTPSFQTCENTFQNKGENGLPQPFSIDKENHQSTSHYYERLLRIYETQNENLSTQNKHLVKIVREMKKKQNQLLDQARKLENYLNNLKSQRNFQDQSEEGEGHNLSILDNFCTKNDPFQAQDPAEQKLKIEELNEAFCELIELSLLQEDEERKKKLRKELADIAKEIKQLRLATMSESDLSPYLNSNTISDEET